MAINYNTVASRIPELSYVAPQNFYMVVESLPEMVFSIQGIQIPNVTGGEVPLPNRMNPNRTFIPGSGIDYTTLDVTFLLDKDFKNYASVLKWIKAINHPENFEQFSEWTNDNTKNTSKEGFAKTTSNMTVFGCDSANNPLLHWNFIDAFPISLDGPPYDASQPNIDYITSVASFRYMYFEFQTYTNGALNNDKI